MRNRWWAIHILHLLGATGFFFKKSIREKSFVGANFFLAF
jgi:hypothetical protein